MDTAPGHMVDEVKKCCKKMNTDIKYIPGGMTPLLQPADTHMNRTTKCFMQDKWNDWMFQEDGVLIKIYISHPRIYLVFYLVFIFYYFIIMF